MRIGMLTVACLALATGCAQGPVASAKPASVSQPAPQSEDARIANLLARMSLERKVAQLIQPQINSFTAADMERYRFGSYLNGGNGGPYGDEFAPAAQWLKLADEMWDASTKPLPGGEPAIPAIWFEIVVISTPPKSKTTARIGIPQRPASGATTASAKCSSTASSRPWITM